MTKRKKIKETIDFCLYGGFDTSIDNLISTLQKCKEDGWEGIDYNYYDGEKDYYVYRNRLETDEEYEKRMKLEAQQKENRRKQYEQQKENRRKQYEQLKKEFG